MSFPDNVFAALRVCAHWITSIPQILGSSGRAAGETDDDVAGVVGRDVSEALDQRFVSSSLGGDVEIGQHALTIELDVEFCGRRQSCLVSAKWSRTV